MRIQEGICDDLDSQYCITCVPADWCAQKSTWIDVFGSLEDLEGVLNQLPAL